MPGTVLPTPRPGLRRLTPANVDLLVDLGSDPEVMRWLTGGRPSTREYGQPATPRILATDESGPSRGTFAAEEVGMWGARRIVGWFHLKDACHWPGELDWGTA